MENRIVPDDDIRASSEKPEREAEKARISTDLGISTDAWSPLDDDEQPYLEVRFPTPVTITSILTQGDENGEYVTEYKVKISPNDVDEPEYLMETVESEDSGPGKVCENTPEISLIEHLKL